MNTGGLLLLLLITFVLMIMFKIPIAYSLGLSSILVICKMHIPITPQAHLNQDKGTGVFNNNAGCLFNGRCIRSNR